MESSTNCKKTQKKVRREDQSLAQIRRKSSSSASSSSWCCSFKSPPKSPEALSLSKATTPPRKSAAGTTLSKSLSSIPNSPQSVKSSLGIVGRIGPRRILSPGRVSPIDSEPSADEAVPISNVAAVQEEEATPAAVGLAQVLNLTDAVVKDEERECNGGGDDGRGGGGGDCGGGGVVFDVRLNLKGKRGGCLALELNSEVLCENSPIFANLVADCRKKAGGSGFNLCRIEVPELDNLGVFRETIELMFEDDITKKLLKMGAYRAIDILEVSASIKFRRGILSCLKYIEAVPWTEEEEDRLRRLFSKCKFDDATTREILARLDFQDSVSLQQNLPTQLICSITACRNGKARNELKSLVKGLLCRSSVYKKDNLDIKEDLYAIAISCLSSLVALFEEACSPTPRDQADIKDSSRPSLEIISWQVDNITWLIEILLESQMAEEFVEMWADQKELVRMHKTASPMVRYELSRISAALFIAMGTRKLHCRAELRFELLCSWFSPMLLDFGWLQRCRKGLDIRQLEEAMGQTLLTLPLNQQYEMFMEWFRCFSKHGTECPNLNKAFQVWWRRTFLRGSETNPVETR